MWRSSAFLLRRMSTVRYGRSVPGFRSPMSQYFSQKVLFSGSTCQETNADDRKSQGSQCKGGGIGGKDISVLEAKRLLRLVNVETLKTKLGMEEEEVIAYSDLLKACEDAGAARSADEAAALVKILDDAGVILLFRDRVYLHPEKVVDIMKSIMPLALSNENDPRKEEYQMLQKKKEEIDLVAHRQVRRILWTGLGLFLSQLGLFFRLTFWEFSWDVMEPITFFTTASGIGVGYTYFLLTSKDLTYQDLMKRLFLSRQRKQFRKQHFDVKRFTELQRQCDSNLDHAPGAAKFDALH